MPIRLRSGIDSRIFWRMTAFFDYLAPSIDCGQSSFPRVHRGIFRFLQDCQSPTRLLKTHGVPTARLRENVLATFTIRYLREGMARREVSELRVTCRFFSLDMSHEPRAPSHAMSHETSPCIWRGNMMATWRGAVLYRNEGIETVEEFSM